MKNLRYSGRVLRDVFDVSATPVYEGGVVEVGRARQFGVRFYLWAKTTPLYTESFNAIAEAIKASCEEVRGVDDGEVA